MKFPSPPLQTPLGSIFEIAACDTPSVCFPLNSFKHLSLNGIPKNLSLQTEIFTPFYRAFQPVFLIPFDWKMVAKGRFTRHLPDDVGKERKERRNIQKNYKTQSMSRLLLKCGLLTCI